MNATDILKSHSIKKTAGRISIINALLENNSPLSEGQIKENMQETYDRITFYRNIHTLASAGIIHRIVVDNTTVKYALNDCQSMHRHQNQHAHFYCEICHCVVCLENVKIPHYELPTGYEYSDSDIIIKGKCKKCNR
jgi:Fur family ferric uptake transcriptional regulator